jgi:tRNA(Ile)-lysidine synthase
MLAHGQWPHGVLEDVRQPLLVGFSGGLDSTVLLHALAASAQARERGLRAVHVHHGLHPDADAWAAHCERICAALQVPLAVMHVRVRPTGHGPEATARAARLAAFTETLREGEALALAHHQDDQAETFLLRALRGSGVEGLRAMRRWRRFGRGWLWRPLLDIPRTALLEYARRHELAWIDDPSNADTTFDRNFLRHRVLPLLRERWPGADAALARSAALQGEAHLLLVAGDARLLLEARAGHDDTLDVRVLRAAPAARRARVLRRWVETLGLPPLPRQGIACIETELLPAPRDATARFAWSGAVVRRWCDVLHAGWERPALPPGWSTSWDGREPLALPDGDRLRLDGPRTGFERPVRVAARRGGERIRLPGRAHSHALKHVLQDHHVPPWVRERLPLLLDDDDGVLAAGDLFVSAAFAEWLAHHGARVAWERMGILGGVFARSV